MHNGLLRVVGVWLLASACSAPSPAAVDATLAAFDGAAPSLDHGVMRDGALVPAENHEGGAIEAGPRDSSVEVGGLDGSVRSGPVTLGTGQDAWEDVPLDGARVELVAGPQGGWHVYGRVRLRGVAPDVYLTFSLAPAGGGAPVNLANETVRRQERRGLTLVGDVYESSVGELVILADGVRPPDVVGRSFRFSVRVERPDPTLTRVLVGGDERVVTVVDNRP